MMKYLQIIVFVALLPVCAFAQGPGQLQGGQVWGNPSASKGPGTGTLIGPLLDQGYSCTARGSMMMRGASLWSCLPPGSTAGQPLLSGGAGADLAYGRLGLGALATGTSDTVIGYWGSTTASALAINNCTNALTYNTTTHTFGCNSSAGTGTVTSISSGTFVAVSTNPCTATCTVDLTAAYTTKPTTQTLTASSGTYTTPANVRWIEGYMMGGAGGGGGTGSSGATGGGNGGDTCWNTSGAACTTPVYKAGGGFGGAIGSTTAGANGGAGGNGGATGGGTSTPVNTGQGEDGGWGSPGVSATFTGRGGKGGAMGCGAGLTTIGGDGASGITGGGGGGAGGSGACTYFIITSPAATYTFANGAVGTAGGGGTGGGAGSAGVTAGKIVIIEHYGS